MTARELVHVRSGDTLRFKEHDTPSGLFKILIPKGTNVWALGIRTYQHDEPATALLAFDAPPVGPGEPSDQDARLTLPRLWDGATLSFYSPPNSGTLLVSQREVPNAFRADRDRWLYLQMGFPSGKAYDWDSQIELHAGAAGPVPDGSTPSLELAHRTVALAAESGLTAALMKMSGAQTDQQLIAWVLQQDGLWFSLCRMVELAENQNYP